MEISITRALAECKILEKRINKKIAEFSPITIQIGNEDIPGYGEKNKFEEYSKNTYTSIRDLINRRMNIKREIILSNSETNIEINGETMTVTEAIDFKNVIVFWENLYNKLRQQNVSINEKQEYMMEEVKNRLDRLLVSNLNKDKSKIKPDEMESISKPFLDRNAPKIIDSININKKIDELEKKINDFKLNIDFILSESNSKTLIEIND